jgi:hypothetical protein
MHTRPLVGLLPVTVHKPGSLRECIQHVDDAKILNHAMRPGLVKAGLILDQQERMFEL